MPLKSICLAVMLLLAVMSPAVAPATADPETQPALFAGLELRAIGPAFMSGRIADIAVDPENTSTWYVAVGSGGVWKTTNAGTTWTPIFEDQAVYSIGCLTLDPRNHNTVWVGTGENVAGRHVGFGDGVYRSPGRPGRGRQGSGAIRRRGRDGLLPGRQRRRRGVRVRCGSCASRRARLGNYNERRYQSWSSEETSL